MRIRVLRRHINKGRVADSLSCPVALAIRERTGKEVDVEICSFQNGSEYANTPKAVAKFVEKFDSEDFDRKDLKPFTFTLPDRLLK